MNKYEIKCIAQNKGAIGTKYKMKTVLKANTPDQAIDSLFDQFVSLEQIIVKEIKC